MDELIPTQWVFKKAHEDYVLRRDPTTGGDIVIRRMISPFYDGEKFAVTNGFEQTYLNKDGEMEVGPSSSNRDDAYYQRCRFDSFEEAVEAAKKYMEKIKKQWEEYQKKQEK